MGKYFELNSYLELTAPFKTAEDFFKTSNAKNIIKAQINDEVFLEELRRITFEKLNLMYLKFSFIDELLSGHILNTIEYIDSFDNELNSEEKDAIFYNLIVKHFFDLT